MSRPVRTLFAVAVGAALGLAMPRVASAEATATILGETSVSSARSVQVRYAGVTPYGRVYLQQCWAGDSPTFDYSVSCSSLNMTMNVVSSAEGDLAFDVFYGDEPMGYDAACGPSAKGLTEHDVCFLRFVPDALDNNVADVFLPMTFAVGAAPSNSAASSVTAASSGASSVAPTVSATSAATSAPSIAVTAVTSSRRSWPIGWYLAAVGGAVVGGFAVNTFSRRRRPQPSTGEAERRDDVTTIR